MIIRDFNDLKNTDRAVSDAQWTSVRMLLADDKMGFSFHHDTGRWIGTHVPLQAPL